MIRRSICQQHLQHPVDQQRLRDLQVSLGAFDRPHLGLHIAPAGHIGAGKLV